MISVTLSSLNMTIRPEPMLEHESRLGANDFTCNAGVSTGAHWTIGFRRKPRCCTGICFDGSRQEARKVQPCALSRIDVA